MELNDYRRTLDCLLLKEQSKQYQMQIPPNPQRDRGSLGWRRKICDW